MSTNNESMGDGAKVLIVEDSPTQAMLLKHLLEENGYHVLSAVTGKDALEILRADRPALVISDIVMPEMNGYELTRAIKEDDELSDIPVILLTALLDPEDVLRGLEAKVDFYLNKPYDEAFLLSKVRSVLTAPQGRANGDEQRSCQVTVNGGTHTVTISAESSLNLLVSTYENAVQINEKLLKTQMELRSFNRDLEQKVRERTAHLQAEIAQRKEAESRVIERTSELEAANKELREFAYVVSHDLKAPLRAVSQLASWISTDHGDSLNEDGREMLELLLGRLDRMHNLVEGILRYSRIGRVKERMADVDLDRVVAEVIDLLAPPENIEMIVENSLPTIRFEPTRAAQLFQNLISNGIKFMDKPHGEIRIACRDIGSAWKFSVSDNGPGIGAKYHEKIFQVFQTLTARDEFESTGVGLAVVKKIVDMGRGEVWLESEEGAGTTFFFTLPKTDGAEPEEENLPEGSAAE
jgi:signal transduction histidine kinase